MKIQIKFSKEEAEGFKQFCKLKPPEVEDESFYKQIFFAGCTSMSQQIQALIDAHQAAQASEGDQEETEGNKDEQTEEQLQDQ